MRINPLPLFRGWGGHEGGISGVCGILKGGCEGVTVVCRMENGGGDVGVRQDGYVFG